MEVFKSLIIGDQFKHCLILPLQMSTGKAENFNPSHLKIDSPILKLGTHNSNQSAHRRTQMLHLGDAGIFRDCLLWNVGRDHFSVSSHPVLPTRRERTWKSTASSSFPVWRRRKSLPACGSNLQGSPWPCSGHMPSMGVALCRGSMSSLWSGSDRNSSP